MPDRIPLRNPEWDPDEVERLIDLLTPLPEAEREARIEQECSGRAALEEEVRSLLEHAPAADRFLRHLQGHIPGPATGPGAEWLPVEDGIRPGSRLGRYRVIERIGSGGMGTVFRAHDDTLDRDVAVKLVSWHLAAIPWVYDRFLGEARAAAALDHPNVCTIHEIGETEDGRPFLAMPCYGGETLRARLQRGPVAPTGAVDIAIAIVRGLAAAHASGIVHRDIKPSNVMLPPDAPPKILDFGIAKLVDAALTDGGHAAGTAAYMSPEQVRGVDPDGRTDLWSTGVVLYEMLAGDRPFQGESDRDIMEAILHTTPSSLSGVDGVSPDLAAVVARLLQRDPESRHASADELLRDLERVRARALPAPARLRRVLQGAAAAAALLFGGLVVAVVSRAGGVPERGDPSLVAILPFAVSGADSSLQYLSEGMLDLLAARLSDASGVRAVEPGDVLRAARRAGVPAGRLRSARARELAAGVGAGRLVTGQVVSLGSRVTLSAALHDAATWGVPRRIAVEGPVDSLPALVDRLTVRLLTLLSGEAERLASITTSSLPALQDYIEGSAMYRRGQYDEAAHRFASAVELDSTFALAALMTIRAGVLARPIALPDRDYAGLAFRYRDRLGTDDRLHLDALIGPEYPDRSPPAALHAARQRLVAARPDDAEAWFRLAEGTPHELARRGVDPAITLERTGEVFRRALALDPSFLPALTQLHLVEASQGDTAAAFRLAQRYLNQVPDGLVAETMRCAMAGVRGGYDSLAVRLEEFGVAALGRCLFDLHFFYIGARAARDSMAAYLDRRSTDPEVLTRALPLMYAVALDRGRPAEAEEYARIWLQTGHGSSLNDATVAVRDALHWEGRQGPAEDGAAYLERWWDTRPVNAESAPVREEIDALCALGQWRIARGRTETAPPVIRTLQEMAGDGRSGLEVRALHCAALLDAWSSLVMGGADLEDRLTELDHMLAEGSPDPRLLRETGFVVARIREARSDLAGAREALDRSFLTSAQYYTSTFRREQGRMAAAAGDTTGAVESYRRYLAMRTDPEAALRSAVDRVALALDQLVGPLPTRLR